MEVEAGKLRTESAKDTEKLLKRVTKFRAGVAVPGGLTTRAVMTEKGGADPAGG
jgi:hypothetical protein